MRRWGDTLPLLLRWRRWKDKVWETRGSSLTEPQGDSRCWPLPPRRQRVTGMETDHGEQHHSCTTSYCFHCTEKDVAALQRFAFLLQPVTSYQSPRGSVFCVFACLKMQQVWCVGSWKLWGDAASKSGRTQPLMRLCKCNSRKRRDWVKIEKTSSQTRSQIIKDDDYFSQISAVKLNFTWSVSSQLLFCLNHLQRFKLNHNLTLKFSCW